MENIEFQLLENNDQIVIDISSDSFDENIVKDKSEITTTLEDTLTDNHDSNRLPKPYTSLKSSSLDSKDVMTIKSIPILKRFSSDPITRTEHQQLVEMIDPSIDLESILVEPISIKFHELTFTKIIDRFSKPVPTIFCSICLENHAIFCTMCIGSCISRHPFCKTCLESWCVTNINDGVIKIVCHQIIYVNHYLHH